MKKFLIVDDSIFTLTRHTELVTQAGGLALTAECGEMALQIFQERQPEIILCDIMMPEMDGYEVFVALKSLDPKVFFYFISAEMAGSAQEKCKKLGADGFFQKPIDIQAIHQVLRHYESTHSN